jgi:hypothetical protein
MVEDSTTDFRQQKCHTIMKWLTTGNINPIAARFKFLTGGLLKNRVFLDVTLCLWVRFPCISSCSPWPSRIKTLNPAKHRRLPAQQQRDTALETWNRTNCACFWLDILHANSMFLWFVLNISASTEIYNTYVEICCQRKSQNQQRTFCQTAKVLIQLLLVTFYENRKNFPYHIYCIFSNLTHTLFTVSKG